jgi:TonB family protein
MPLAGKAIPSLAKDNASPSENYPPKARIGDIEASVVLQVAISETGCMEIAQVIETSGVDELDEAALLWAERANFVPAEKDQKPAAGTMPFKFTYKISD